MIYSDEARRDLRTIYNYIATELGVPEIAAGQVQRIRVRVVPVDNYLIFYLPEEKSHAINILRIMYKGREINKKL